MRVHKSDYPSYFKNIQRFWSDSLLNKLLFIIIQQWMQTAFHLKRENLDFKLIMSMTKCGYNDSWSSRTSRNNMDTVTSHKDIRLTNLLESGYTNRDTNAGERKGRKHLLWMSIVCGCFLTSVFNQLQTIELNLYGTGDFSNYVDFGKKMGIVIYHSFIHWTCHWVNGYIDRGLSYGNSNVGLWVT